MVGAIAQVTGRYARALDHRRHFRRALHQELLPGARIRPGRPDHASGRRAHPRRRPRQVDGGVSGESSIAISRQVEPGWARRNERRRPKRTLTHCGRGSFATVHRHDERGDARCGDPIAPGLLRRGDDGLARSHRAAQSARQRDRRARRPRDACWRRRSERDAQLARGDDRGPLHGFPHAIKDLAPVKGMRMTMGSPAAQGLRAAGRQRHGRAHAQGRRDLHRPDQHAGVRPRLAHLQSGLRHDPQRLRSDALGRRQQRRRGGRAGAAHAAASPTAATMAAACAIRPAGTTCSASARAIGRVPADGRDAWLPSMGVLGPMARSVPDLACCSRCRRATTRACRCRWTSDRAHSSGRGDGVSAARASPGAATSTAAAVRARRARHLPRRAARRSKRWAASSRRRSRTSRSTRSGTRGCSLRAWQSRRRPARLLQRPGDARAAEARSGVRGRERSEASRLRYYRRLGGAHAMVSSGAAVLRDATITGSCRPPRCSPSTPTLDWPSEIAGRKMATYHEWMKGVLPVTMAGCPALAAPAGFGEAGPADRHPDRRPQPCRPRLPATGPCLRCGNELAEQIPPASAQGGIKPASAVREIKPRNLKRLADWSSGLLSATAAGFMWALFTDAEIFITLSNI